MGVYSVQSHTKVYKRYRQCPNFTDDKNWLLKVYKTPALPTELRQQVITFIVYNFCNFCFFGSVFFMSEYVTISIISNSNALQG